jgi:uncharacterized protein (DUF849 family)
LNGGVHRDHHPMVPITAAQLAADAIAAREAGAEELHVHARDDRGNETLERSFVEPLVLALRDATPGMRFGFGTGAWTAPGGRLRHPDMSAWTIVPDYASVNLCEEDALDVAELLLRRGVGIEAGVWSVDDAHRLVSDLRPEQVHRVLVEMMAEDPHEALSTADEVLAVLVAAGWDRPILLHGDGGSAWPCLRRAALLGLDSRIGLEDTLYLEDGTVAPDNASLLRAARRIMDIRMGTDETN